MSTGLSEAQIGARCDALASLKGWDVHQYEPGRSARVSEGLPTRRYVHRGRQLVLWVVLRSPKDLLTSAQHHWLTAEHAAGALAAAIDSEMTFSALLRVLERDGSVARSEAHRRCGELTELVARRGYRRIPKAKAPAAAQLQLPVRTSSR